MSSHYNISHRLKEKARGLGFHAVGITTAEPFSDAAEHLRSRLQKDLLKNYGFTPGCEAHFTCPEETLAGARSIVAVALSYYYRPACPDCEDFITGEPQPRGRVSRFAWGLDYHHAVETRLAVMDEWLRDTCGADSGACVDTGSLLDRAAAVRAGIGWYGKNGLVIIPQYGSWTVLGELITTAELEPDGPSNSDRCGSCDLCVKTCPTGAIVAPGVIDADKCISHLTQMKGYAPRELRPLVADRVYGCDTCQEVCPQNRNVFPTDAVEFAKISSPGRKPPLISLLQISPERFRSDIGVNTMGWIRRTRLRRNAAVALGNVGDPAASQALMEALSDAEAVIRGHAAWALGQIGLNPQSRRSVGAALSIEQDEAAKTEMTASLEGHT